MMPRKPTDAFVAARYSHWILYPLCSIALLSAVPSVHAEEFEAVSARRAQDYVRTKLPDGGFAPETYAFGKGGYWSGPLNDRTIDKMDFMDVARIISKPLASQHYLPATDPKTTELLIMVYWGTTFAPEHASESIAYQKAGAAQLNLSQATIAVQHASTLSEKKVAGDMMIQADNELSTAIAATQAENRMRDNVDRRNAMMLGYDSVWDATFNAQNGTALAVRKQEVLDELEEYRYFVVLMAYDFQLLAKEKKHKLLWETRFSIRQHVNAFDGQLPAMALQASHYFGRDSGGLVHDSLPDGKVDLGEIRNLGNVEAK